LLKANSQILCILGVFILFLALITFGKASNNYFLYSTGLYFLPDSVAADSVARDSLETGPYLPSKKPTYQPRDRFGDPFSHSTSPSPLQLKDPASLKMDVEIDTGMNYTIYEKIGDVNYRPTSSMTFEEFNEYQERQIIRNYWKKTDHKLWMEKVQSVEGIWFPGYISARFSIEYLEEVTWTFKETGL